MYYQFLLTDIFRNLKRKLFLFLFAFIYVQIHNYSLLWFTLSNAHENDISGQLQYTRIVWPNHPKLIVINLKLCNQNTCVDLTNIQFDLMNSVIGRLLVDANRIQSFNPIGNPLILLKITY